MLSKIRCFDDTTSYIVVDKADMIGNLPGLPSRTIYDKEKGKYYYMFYDSGLIRLRRFYNGIMGNGLTTAEYEIGCFPWQENILKAYLPPNSQISVSEMDAIEGILGIE